MAALFFRIKADFCANQTCTMVVSEVLHVPSSFLGASFAFLGFHFWNDHFEEMSDQTAVDISINELRFGIT